MARRVLYHVGIPVLLLLAGCQGGSGLDLGGLLRSESDEERIGALLDDVHEAMQTKKLKRVMAYVSPEYLDQEGRDYEGIRDYLDQIMKDYRDIEIRRSPPTIVVEGDRARAMEAFGTQATPGSDRTPPINIQGQVAVYLERGPDGWKIVEWGSIS